MTTTARYTIEDPTQEEAMNPEPEVPIDDFDALMNEMLGEAAKEPTANPIDAVKGTTTDALFACLSKLCGADALPTIKSNAGSAKNLFNYLSLIMSIARTVRNLDYDGERTKSLTKFEYADLKDYAASIAVKRELIHPFNWESKIINEPFAKIEYADGYVRTFTIGNRTVRVDMTKVSKAWPQVKEFFEAAGHMRSTILYTVADLDDWIIKVTRMMVAWTTLSVDRDHVEVVYQPVAKPPPGTCDLKAQAYDAMAGIVKRILSKFSYAHWYNDYKDVKGFYYANLSIMDWENDAVLKKALSDYKKMCQNKEALGVGKFVEKAPDAIVSQEVVNNVKLRVDNLKDEAMKVLDRSRGWRSQTSKVMDKATHDISMPVNVPHLSDNKWGMASRYNSCVDALNEIGCQPNDIFLRGGGADTAAYALRICSLEDPQGGNLLPYPVTYPTTQVYMSHDSPLEGVENVIQRQPPSVRNGSIVMVFSQPSDDRKFVEHLDMYLKMLTPGPLNNVLVAEHNHCSLEIYIDILDWVEKNNLAVYYRRHPRYHNSSCAWHFVQKAKGAYDPALVGQCYKDRVTMSYQIINNNKWRNAVIVTGMYDEVETTGTLSNEITVGERRACIMIDMIIRENHFWKKQAKNAKPGIPRDSSSLARQLKQAGLYSDAQQPGAAFPGAPSPFPSPQTQPSTGINLGVPQPTDMERERRKHDAEGNVFSNVSKTADIGKGPTTPSHSVETRSSAKQKSGKS